MTESERLISFVAVLETLRPIGLEEMDGIRLMNRTDAKYLTDEATLLGILADAAAAGYRVLETGGERISPYDSVYYDTEGLQMYLDHRNSRLVRQKVRTRNYVRSGTAFLEIKQKNNKGRTRKSRTGIPTVETDDFRGDAAACAYLAAHSRFRADELSPSAETAFRRITLVNPGLSERLTIDTCLQFRNFRTGNSASLQQAVILELKQDGRAASRMKSIFLARRVKPFRISKYCIAIALTDPQARVGRFKPKLRAIEKIIGNKLSTP